MLDQNCHQVAKVKVSSQTKSSSWLWIIWQPGCEMQFQQVWSVRHCWDLRWTLYSVAEHLQWEGFCQNYHHRYQSFENYWLYWTLYPVSLLLQWEGFVKIIIIFIFNHSRSMRDFVYLLHIFNDKLDKMPMMTTMIQIYILIWFIIIAICLFFMYILL